LNSVSQSLQYSHTMCRSLTLKPVVCNLFKNAYMCANKCINIHRQNSVDVAVVQYDRDRKKEFAPNYSAYYPFGVDVFLSPRKVDHIARFVELPTVSSSAKFPPILVVNVQVLLLCLNFLVTHFFVFFPKKLYEHIVAAYSQTLCFVDFRFRFTLQRFFKVKLMAKERVLSCTLSFRKVMQRNFLYIFKKTSE